MKIVQYLQINNRYINKTKMTHLNEKLKNNLLYQKIKVKSIQ